MATLSERCSVILCKYACTPNGYVRIVLKLCVVYANILPTFVIKFASDKYFTNSIWPSNIWCICACCMWSGHFYGERCTNATTQHAQCISYVLRATHVCKCATTLHLRASPASVYTVLTNRPPGSHATRRATRQLTGRLRPEQPTEPTATPTSTTNTNTTNTTPAPQSGYHC